MTILTVISYAAWPSMFADSFLEMTSGLRKQAQRKHSLSETLSEVASVC